jgi:hypothetical protein
MRLGTKFIVSVCSIAIPVAVGAQTTPPADPSQAPPETQTQTAPMTKATAADVKAGAAVFDPKGNSVGKIESADSEGAVVSTGSAKAKIPLASFSRSDKGLVIAMTRAELEAAAKEKAPK